MKKPQLFLLHFAGGSCYSFQFLKPLLTDFDVIPLELPGRGKRGGEMLLRDFDLAAMDIYNQLLAKLNPGYFIIYGHSLGAYMALRVTGLLERNGRHPACLIVSGNAGPGCREQTKTYLLPHDEFVNELEKLGGIPPEILANKELFNFFEPVLRADFELAECNGMDEEPAVDTPIFALMGTKEKKVTEISGWKRFTKSKFNYHVLEGDHFFIFKHPNSVADIIRNSYQRFFLLRKH